MLKITQKPSPNFVAGRQGQIPDHICLHTTGGTFTSADNWIRNAASQVSYHFIIKRDGEIVQYVDIRNWAFANGTRNDGGNLCNSRSTLALVRQRRINANLYTVSISFADMPAGNPSPQQLESVVALINWINNECQRIYGARIPIRRDRVVGHGEITPVTRANCPGKAFPFDEVIRRVNAAVPTPAPTSIAAVSPTPAPTPATPTRVINVGDLVTIKNSTPRAVYGGKTKARGTEIPTRQLTPAQHLVTAIQTNNGDGEARLGDVTSGINSWVALTRLDVVGNTAPPVTTQPAITPTAPAIRSARAISDDIWLGRRTNNGQLWGTGAVRKANLIKYGGEDFQKEVQRILNELDAAARARR
jgi:N-acetyl-anhydromuramyl-L-alanine amidase AmpD